MGLRLPLGEDSEALDDALGRNDLTSYQSAYSFNERTKVGRLGFLNPKQRVFWCFGLRVEGLGLRA